MRPTATKKPDAILSELGISEPAEIHIEAIAIYCGATIVYEPLGGCEAQILGHGNRAIITVNSASSRPRQRFSAAHELGHWMFDRGRIAFACSEDNFLQGWDSHNPERRANQYAAELLLPTRMLARRAKKQPVTFDTVRKLARTFETSLTATAIRLVELGEHPAMVVCSDVAGRKWFTASPVVPSVLWPSRKPGHGSLAARLLAGARALEPQFVDATEWVSHADSHRYCIYEDSLFFQSGVVLSLLWWKDESQLLELDEE